MKKTAVQFVRYAVVGLISNATAYLLYLALTSADMEPKLAMTLLYGIGVAQTFIFNKRWSFQHSGVHGRAFVRYCISYGLGYVINLLTLIVLVDRMGYPHQIVQGFMVLCLACMLFLLQKFWVFSTVTQESDNTMRTITNPTTNWVNCYKAKFGKYDALAIFACLLVTITIYSQIIFSNQVIPNADLHTHYRWLVQYQATFAEGSFYPRWMPLAKLGLGELLYNAYPIYYDLASALMFIGLEPWSAMKILATASNFLGGIVAYFYFIRLIDRRTALAGAVMLQISPLPFFLFSFHAALPWQFSFFIATVLILQSFPTHRQSNKALLAFTVATLTLTHVLVAFMTLLCLGLVKIAGIIRDRRLTKDFFIAWCLPALFGIGLAAFQLVPEISARTLINQETAADPIYLNWRNSFAFSTVTAAIWGFRWFTVQWIVPTTSLLCLTASTYTLWKSRNYITKIWSITASLCALSGVGLLLASEVAFPLYYLGLLNAVQWPYRFLTLASLGSALALPLSISLCRSITPKLKICSALCWLAASIPLLLIAVFQVQLLREGVNPKLSHKLLNGEFHQAGNELATEGTQWKEYALAGGFQVNCSKMNVKCNPVLTASQKRQWNINTEASARLVLPMFAFPGWTVRIDDNEITSSIDLSTGLVAVEVPSGQHRLEIILTGLPQEKIGILISIISLLGLLIFIRLSRRYERVQTMTV